jgi:phosphoribosylglycinamide formyltransferase-1
MRLKRVAILISGRGSNMAALIAAAREPGYPAEIALVISNVADAAGLVRAREAGIKTAVVEHKPFGRDRAAFEAALQSVLDANDITLICLAGFMRLFTASFVQRWHGRMLNIHPSLLPSFPGLDPHGQALRAGVKISGATVHFVIPETDAGPIVAQGAVAVHDDDTPESLGARVLAVEHRVYPLALRLLAEDRIRLADGRSRIDGARESDEALLVPTMKNPRR